MPSPSPGSQQAWPRVLLSLVAPLVLRRYPSLNLRTVACVENRVSTVVHLLTEPLRIRAEELHAARTMSSSSSGGGADFFATSFLSLVAAIAALISASST